MRIKAAVDARKESGSDIVIVARTDSRQAVSLEESLWRSRAFADAGADVLFIDALASKEEMKAFCGVYPLVPKMVCHIFHSTNQKVRKQQISHVPDNLDLLHSFSTFSCPRALHTFRFLLLCTWILVT